MKILLPARHQYDQDTKAEETQATAIVCLDETLTVQAPPEEIDLNAMLRRMGVTDGTALPAMSGVTDPSYYGDFTDAPDLRTALDNIRDAEEKFMALPPTLREKFQNNALNMLQWVHDARNYDEAVELKMLRKVSLIEKPEPPVPTPPAPAPPGNNA